MILKQQATKKVSADDSPSVATEEKFIKRLRAQHRTKQEAEHSRKTLHKCLQKVLSRNRRTHELMDESAQEEEDEVR
jgi:hypothetical protein